MTIIVVLTITVAICLFFLTRKKNISLEDLSGKRKWNQFTIETPKNVDLILDSGPLTLFYTRGLGQQEQIRVSSRQRKGQIKVTFESGKVMEASTNDTYLSPHHCEWALHLLGVAHQYQPFKVRKFGIMAS